MPGEGDAAVRMPAALGGVALARPRAASPHPISISHRVLGSTAFNPLIFCQIQMPQHRVHHHAAR